VRTATYVALIRGINVGRAKRVSMADLRSVVAELGYGDVRTLLNSGNLLFSSPPAAARHAAARIERSLEASLELQARVLVLTPADVATIVAENPLTGVATNPSRLMVSVPFDSSHLGLLGPLVRRDWSPEALAVGSGAAYVWCPDGMHDSHVVKAVAGVLKDGVTTRNWATVEKLHALLKQ